MPKYHLKRKDKEITSQTDMQAIIKRGQYTVIALCQNDEPYIVTMNYGYDGKKNTLYFHAALEGLKLEFIEHNPKSQCLRGYNQRFGLQAGGMQP